MVWMKAVIKVTWKYCWLAYLTMPTYGYLYWKKHKNCVLSAGPQLMHAMIPIE